MFTLFHSLIYLSNSHVFPPKIRVRKQLAEAQKSYEKLDLYQDSLQKIDQLESEFGAEDEESEDEEEGDEENEESEDDDVIIEREMDIPESGMCICRSPSHMVWASCIISYVNETESLK